ncbi:hypothetical protein C8J57DRAFT_1361645, partial [Mycena rebaudengoi]
PTPMHIFPLPRTSHPTTSCTPLCTSGRSPGRSTTRSVTSPLMGRRRRRAAASCHARRGCGCPPRGPAVRVHGVCGSGATAGTCATAGTRAKGLRAGRDRRVEGREGRANAGLLDAGVVGLTYRPAICPPLSPDTYSPVVPHIYTCTYQH